MSDGEALLKAILANPEEDTPRLVYADWLEENGFDTRAAFIRLQVEIARMRVKPPPVVKLQERPQRCRRCGGFWASDGTCHCQAGDRRQKSIRQKLWNRSAWEAELKLLLDRENDLMSKMSTWDYSKGVAYSLWMLFVEMKWHRGFIDAIKCRWEDWRENAEKILAAHPVREVTLITPAYRAFKRGEYNRNNVENGITWTKDELQEKWKGISFFRVDPARQPASIGDASWEE